MTRVVLLVDYFDRVREFSFVKELAKRVELKIYTEKAASEAETAERLRDADIVITFRDRVIYTPSLLAQMEHVQLLAACGARFTHIDLEAATKRGILITAPPNEESGGFTKTGTAEQTWNLILGLMKETTMNDRAMREGGWQKNPSRGLAGKTLGLLGVGIIGKQIAQIGNAMRMRVIAWSPHLTAERAGASGAECVSFEKVFSDSDIVSIHIPLMPNNCGLIGEKELGLMQPHSFLINTARAGLVKEEALRKVLEQRKIAGVGLDVYWEEPLPADHWLRRQENVLLQPHLGGMTDKGYESLVAPAVDNVMAYLDGRPKNLVNPEVLEGRRGRARL